MAGWSLRAVVSVVTFVAACGRVSTESHPTADAGDGTAPNLDANAGDERGPGADADIPDGQTLSADADAPDGRAPSADLFEKAGEALTEADLEEIRRYTCFGWRAPAQSWAARLFIVLDASSSMNEPAPGGDGQSKWQVVRDAVSAAVTSLSDAIAVGLLAYPNQAVEGSSGDRTACVNTGALLPLCPIGEGDHRQSMVDALHAVELNPCRPTHDAYVTGLEALAAPPAAAPQYLLLITDGQPTLTLNCEPGDCTTSLAGAEQAVIDEIDSAFHGRRVRTFLFGLPGSEVDATTGNDARWWLSQAAEAGETSPGNCSHDVPPYCHYDVAQADELAPALDQALRDAFGQVDDCRYELPLPPEGEQIDLNKIDFVAWPDGGQPIHILNNESPGCQAGWYADDTTQLIRFCPETCAAVRSDPLAELEIIVGCTGPILP